MTDKFCRKCGVALKARASFCRQCGTPVKTTQAKPRVNPRKKKKAGISPPTMVLILGGVLLAAAALFYFIDRPAAVSQIASTPSQPSIPFPDVARVSLSTAKAGFDNGTAVFLDVRTQSDYQQSHIPNAISMPQTEIAERYLELSPDAEIMTYCT